MKLFPNIHGGDVIYCDKCKIDDNCRFIKCFRCEVKSAAADQEKKRFWRLYVVFGLVAQVFGLGHHLIDWLYKIST
jgi:hypothetical protein